jgi:hypothetical protein
MVAFGFSMWTWICMYLINKSAYINMVGATTYYFSANKDTQGESEIVLGFKWAYTKNFGSLCLGSAIIPIMGIIRYLTDKHRRGVGFGIFACVGACLKCYCFMISTHVDYIDHNGFAMCAISGSDFIKSSWFAFLLNLR